MRAWLGVLVVMIVMLPSVAGALERDLADRILETMHASAPAAAHAGL